VWGNGATFDNVILANAYDACRIRRPWKYYADMCFRTVRNQYPHVQVKRQGTHHNALDDALTQAHHLQAIYKEMQK
jgi:exodeoxyribonuclease VIII